MKLLIRLSPILGLALVLCFAALRGEATTQAADGDPLQPAIIAARTGACASTNAAGDHAGVGVGIAFNGTNLLISCSNDNSLAEINPLTGAQVGPLHIVGGATSLGALAYDGLNNVLYACSGSNTVGTINLVTYMFSALFDTSSVSFAGLGGGFGSGCFDGLAYDGTGTPSIWASGDVSPTTEHYTLAGAAIMKFTNSLGSCGNSGIAVGGANLYLANNGCSEIYTVNKTFTSSVLFASFPARLEDLECDSVTFKVSQNKSAIWSIDAYDNRLNAWEIAPDLCAFGGGITPTPSPAPSPTPPVGGIVALAVSDSGSVVLPWMALAAGALAVLAAGFWYSRKRWLR